MGIGKGIHLEIYPHSMRFTFAPNRGIATLSLSEVLHPHANEGRPVAPPV